MVFHGNLENVFRKLYLDIFHIIFNFFLFPTYANGKSNPPLRLHQPTLAGGKIILANSDANCYHNIVEGKNLTGSDGGPSVRHERIQVDSMSSH